MIGNVVICLFTLYGFLHGVLQGNTSRTVKPTPGHDGKIIKYQLMSLSTINHYVTQGTAGVKLDERI